MDFVIFTQESLLFRKPFVKLDFFSHYYVELTTG